MEKKLKSFFFCFGERCSVVFCLFFCYCLISDCIIFLRKDLLLKVACVGVVVVFVVINFVMCCCRVFIVCFVDSFSLEVMFCFSFFVFCLACLWIFLVWCCVVVMMFLVFCLVLLMRLLVIFCFLFMFFC